MKRTKTKPTKSAKLARRAAASLQKPLRDRVLGAAFSAFMEKGYADTSTLEIATRARVSKRELYAVCADKSALLRDAITERTKQMRLALELPAATSREALATTLTTFGTAILGGVCDTHVLALHRLAIAESARAPGVAMMLESAGREANRAALRQTLAQAQADDLVGAGDPAAMAADFFALLWGDLLLRLLLGVAKKPQSQDLERKAREATKKLLRLYS
jgi:AcrR family transcriptional regulator